MREQSVDGPRAVRDRVLLGEGHLRERLQRAFRHEDRVEAETARAPLPVRDRPARLAVEDLMVSASPQEEDRLERRAAVAHTVHERQDPGAPEALVDVRRADARVQELRGDLAALPFVRRDECDHVYRPRSSISRTFRTTASAAFPMTSRYPRTT